MLNESFILLKALEKANINLPFEHPRIKDVAKSGGPCLRVRLDTCGRIEDVEEITDEEYNNLWIIVRTCDGSFPVVRINEPITVLKNSKAEEYKDVRPWGDARAKAEEINKAINDTNKDCIVNSFIERFLKATENPQDLLKEIDKKAIDKFQNNRISKKLFEALQIGKQDKKNKTITKFQLAFDVDNDTIYNNKIRNEVSHILPISSQGLKDQQGPIAKCAYTKSEGDIQNTPFPTIPLPIIGKKGFPLVSMFSAAPCNTRYGLTDSAIVPVKQLLTSQIFCALRYITSDPKKGKTWRGIARGEYKKQGKKKIEKKDLLIVYVDGKPDVPVNVANIFGTDEDSIVKQFETDAKTVCDTLDGIARTVPKSKLNLFVLRDVSPGQVQVVQSDSFSVNNFIESANRWQNAIKNLPEIDLLLPAEQKDEKGIITKPPILYPDEVVKILSKKYTCQGLDVREVMGISFGEVLDFMFRKEGKWKDVLDKILSLAIYDYYPLLIGVFGAKHSYESTKYKEYSPQFRKDALKTISLISLILDANNRNKETYMKDAAFKIGGFLALADILHKDYCIVVRKNSLPPSLIGNAMMPNAFDNPCFAVADLADRMRVYTGWAKTAKIPDGDNSENKIAVLQAKKTLKYYELLSKELHDIGLPEQCSDGMKAEILLGYLASTKGINTEINETEKGVNL
jgi:hypothetical protein